MNTRLIDKKESPDKINNYWCMETLTHEMGIGSQPTLVVLCLW